jgi:hypothetical protein
MFAQGSGHHPCSLADAKETLRDNSLRSNLRLQLAEHGNHFLAEPLAVKRRVETQRLPIKAEAEHRSGLRHRDPQIGQTREMFHPAHFELQVSESPCRQTIRLPASRTILLFESLNPFCVQQSTRRAVELPVLSTRVRRSSARRP